MKLKTGKYLVVDTETTGFYPSKNGLIQVGAVALNDQLKIIDSFNLDVCPKGEFEISQESLEVTGFTIERIEKGVEYEIFGKKFAKFLDKNFSGKIISVGQFYPFDYAFIEMALSKTKYHQSIMQDKLSNDFIDTKAVVNFLNLKARLNNQELPFTSTSLSKPGGLKEKLNIQNYKAHDAMGDVLATVDVLRALAEKF
jgi:DNA polymerase III epsilon subunit-like protein